MRVGRGGCDGAPLQALEEVRQLSCLDLRKDQKRGCGPVVICRPWNYALL